MNSNKVVRIGTRDSRLALIQAQMVADAITKWDGGITVRLVPMKTSGDLFLDRRLDEIGGKGLFVKELDRALLEHAVDITVHSFKDMPMEQDESLPIVACSRREDPRDVLILPKTAGDGTLPFGCSSLRRKLQLEALFPGKTSAPVRGNVLTRLEKLDRHEYEGLVLAAAGIIRLGLTDRISRYFEPDELLPAACQGIIAVQARRGENTEYLTFFHSQDSQDIACAERAYVRTLDGGCSSPVAAYATVDGDTLTLRGLYVDERTGLCRRGTLSGDRAQAEALGRTLALRLSGRKEEV